MQDRIFEYDKEKVIINALRLYGVMEYDSELLDLENKPNDKILMVTVKIKEPSSSDNEKEKEYFKYGICPLNFGEYFSTQKNLFHLMQQGKSLSILNAENLPLYYLTDYRNIIVTNVEEMRKAIKEDDGLTLEGIKEEYELLQIKEIIKNMKNNNYLINDEKESIILDKKIITFFSDILIEYITLGKKFFETFNYMDKENMEKSIIDFPDCKELRNVCKTLE